MPAGAKAWAYYPAGDVWLPLRCNAAGQLEVDLTLVDLGDLGDVNLAGLADGDLIVWNAAAGEWQAITPANMAGDIDINDLNDVTAPTPQEWDFLLRRGANYQSLNLIGFADWGVMFDFTHWVDGGGTVLSNRAFKNMTVWFAAAGPANCISSTTWGPNPQNYGYDFEWSIVLLQGAFFGAGVTTWIKLDNVATSADPAVSSVGFRIDNQAVMGITWNGVLNVVNLGFNIATGVFYTLKIKFFAGVRVEWWINGVLYGQSAAVPAGILAFPRLVFSTALIAGPFAQNFMNMFNWGFIQHVY